MEFYDMMKTRRSVRWYRSDPIPDDVLDRVLDAARLAPSGSNRPPARLILVEDEQARKRRPKTAFPLPS
jgi:nitroreductase